MKNIALLAILTLTFFTSCKEEKKQQEETPVAKKDVLKLLRTTPFVLFEFL